MDFRKLETRARRRFETAFSEAGESCNTYNEQHELLVLQASFAGGGRMPTLRRQVRYGSIDGWAVSNSGGVIQHNSLYGTGYANSSHSDGCRQWV